MNEKELNQLVAAVLLALDRVDLVRRDQIEILEKSLERLRTMEEVDETALLLLVGTEVN